MKSFTRIEISWIVKLLDEEAKRLDAVMMVDGAAPMEQALAAYMRENYQSVKSRLAEAIENKNKRIEIKY